ncbi:MAG: hypothetical protein JZD41_04370 [Thermoproteus sp.]|nr:hypothetical protein [Thermoproteus sp.]
MMLQYSDGRAAARRLLQMRYDDVARVVARGLANLIAEARGNVVTTTARRALKYGGVDTTVPMALMLANYVLRRLAEKGAIEVDGQRPRKRRTRYILRRGTQLWEELKAGNIEVVVRLAADDLAI